MSRFANAWKETAVAAPDVEPLRGRAAAEVLVIGAGYLGLSAALHLAEAGMPAIVLDAGQPGCGASGANGGQLIPGLKHDPDEIERTFGRERGGRLCRLAGGTADFVLDLVQRLKLRAEARRTTWIHGVHSRSAARLARSRAEQWQRRGADVAYVGTHEAARLIGTDAYIGAYVNYRAGCLQPLSYARELARAALAAGASIHGESRVVSLASDPAGWKAITASGAEVTAAKVLVCTNAYSDGLIPELPRSIIATTSLQIATEPLPAELRAAILPGGGVLSDTRRIIRYWRLDGAGRLLLGSRGPYREPGPERDWSHLVREVPRLYPALAGVAITHRWGGRVALHPDSWPRFHRLAAGVWTMIGCQGRGVGWQTVMGAELAQLARDARYDPALPVSPVKPIAFGAFKRIGVSAAIGLMCLQDRLRC